MQNGNECRASLYAVCNLRRLQKPWERFQINIVRFSLAIYYSERFTWDNKVTGIKPTLVIIHYSLRDVALFTYCAGHLTTNMNIEMLLNRRVNHWDPNEQSWPSQALLFRQSLLDLALRFESAASASNPWLCCVASRE